MAVILSQVIRKLRAVASAFSPAQNCTSSLTGRNGAASAVSAGAAGKRPPAPRRGPTIQSLESRTLYAAGGLVTGEQLLGSNDAVTAIVLKVNQHLDPVTASNPHAYQVYHRLISTDSGSDGVFGFGGSDSSTSITRLGLRFSSVVYDDAAMTVTLTPTQPFPAQKYFTFILIHGHGVNGIDTADGTPIAGNGNKPGSDFVVRFRLHFRKTFTYTEADGDRVTLKLTGPGVMRTFVRRLDTPDPIVTISGANPVQDVLTGTVKKSRRGDGIAHLQELLGASQVQDQLSSNPAFSLASVEP
jgi:hypothetical protein